VAEASHAIFLSYASQDTEAAQKIGDALCAAGIEVFLDQTELRGGDAWEQRIRHEIHDCVLFVPVISQHTQERLEGYFRHEWNLAIERAHHMARQKPFLVPVVIDGTGDREAFVPDEFRAVQWTRLPDGEVSPAFVERVQRLLSPSGSATAIAGENSGAGRGNRRISVTDVHRNTAWLRPALLIAASIVLLGSAYLAIQRYVLTKQAASAIGEKSVAVLPFVDLSEKHDQEYFADGMAEEIIDLLAKVPELKVIGRISAFQFKGKTGDLRNIGKALGAAYVVEGSVRNSGDHVRVTAQLIDTRDGAHRWAETYDRSMQDVFRVQDEIALGLVRALQVEVASSVFSQAQATPQAAEANDSYLRGLHARDRHDRRGFEEAAADFRHALEVDPTFAPGAEALALALKDMATWAFVPSRTGYPQARTAAEAALKLDPQSALAHAVLCNIDFAYEWDWSAAARECETADHLGPHQPYVRSAMALARMAVGEWSEATYVIEAARALDPLDPRISYVAGVVYLHAGRLAEAEAALRRSLAISPTYVRAHHFLGIALVLQGRPQEALTEMQQETGPGGQAAGLVLAYHALHRDPEALAALARLEAEDANDAAMLIAEACAFIGDKDQAFIWLERAYAQKDSRLFHLKGDPLTRNLEGDPRYRSFLRKMNLPE